MTEQQISRNKFSFSQAEGIEPLPQPLALGELSVRARSLLWSYIYESLQNCVSHSSSKLLEPWRTILYDYHTDFLYKPADEVKNYFKIMLPV